MLPALLTTIFFSLSAVTGHRCAKIFGGIEANFYRLTTATVLLGLYVLVFGTSISGPAATMFVLSGLVGVGFGDLLFFQALPRIGSRLTILLIQCLSVPFAALVEWLWLGTTLTWKQMIGSAVVVFGLCIALFPGGSKDKLLMSLFPGAWFAILAAFGNGFGAVLSRKAYFLAAENGLAVTGPSAAFQRVLGGLAVAITAVMVARWPQIQNQLLQLRFSLPGPYASRWKQAWPWVVSTSLAGQTLGVTCFQWALKNHPTGVVLPIIAMTPLVAVPITHIFEGERPTFKSVIGGIIAVAGVILLVTVG